MNIKELKELIESLPDEMRIIMSKDSEGNGFSPLADTNPNSVYVSDSTWSGDVYDLAWKAYDAGMEESDWEELKKTPRVLVLWPIN